MTLKPGSLVILRRVVDSRAKLADSYADKLAIILRIFEKDSYPNLVFVFESSMEIRVRQDETEEVV